MKKGKKTIIGGGGRLEEIRRTARLLDIIQNIAVAPRRWTRKALAARYEISERQIQKDLTIIRYRLHLDLQNEGDGYYFRSIPRLPTLSYSFSEALALLLAARVGQTLPGIDSSELSSAIARLESLFPKETIPLLKAVTEDIPEYSESKDRLKKLTLLHRALAEKKQVKIVYRTASRGNISSTRLVEPYRIIPYLKTWQLVAFCHSRKEIREFNIDRIEKAEILDSTYEIPPDFDLDSFFGHIWGVYRQSSKPAEEVELEFEPEAGLWVAEGVWHKSQKLYFEDNGRVRLKLFISISPDFICWLLHFGWRVKVLKPEWLKEKVKEELIMALKTIND
ncbi:MAG: WYL domain-containing protein [Candidatus Aminicenantes bacterium]|nr:WYL domain-containing protein [Candidatus Aminicenantes bacterium]